MKYLNKAKSIIPFLILFTLLSLLCRELYSANSDHYTQGFSGDAIPSFSLPYLNNPKKSFTQQDLRGKVSLVNIWASWCSACKAEHSMLMNIKENYGIPIYGILYKDDASNALQYLNHRGNPYKVIGNDEYGDAGIDFGIYGTPETYVVGPNGEVLYRQVGVISKSKWNNVIYPIIKPYLKKK